MLLHDVAVGEGQLLEVVVCAVVIVAYQSVEGVEGVEEEVWVDLFFEGVVAVLDIFGLCAFFFEEHSLMACEVVEEDGDEDCCECHEAVFDHADVDADINA